MYMYINNIVYIIGLRKKTVAPGMGVLDDHIRNPGSTDLFGSADAIVKHVLEVSSHCILYIHVHVTIM